MAAHTGLDKANAEHAVLHGREGVGRVLTTCLAVGEHITERTVNIRERLDKAFVVACRNTGKPRADIEQIVCTSGQPMTRLAARRIDQVVAVGRGSFERAFGADDVDAAVALVSNRNLGCPERTGYAAPEVHQHVYIGIERQITRIGVHHRQHALDVQAGKLALPSALHVCRDRLHTARNRPFPAENAMPRCPPCRQPHWK